MKKYIVTTTIYQPSEAMLRFIAMEDWTVIVVGDLKTPKNVYEKLNCIYLSPEYQELTYPELSDAIGWNCIMRRNIGYIEAYKRGADIVATVDDDNIPYSYWQYDVSIDSAFDVDVYSCDSLVFDPMQLTNHPELWHRGYPLEQVQGSKRVHYRGPRCTKVLIQANLWDGDPDIDAVCRKISGAENLKLTIPGTFTTDQYAPFNSQNTLLARDILPHYMVLPHIGRMDDIWGGYICQYLTGARPVFEAPNVFQQRNIQAIKKNLMDEVIGYTDTGALMADIENWRNYLPERTLLAFDLYRKEYE